MGPNVGKRDRCAAHHALTAADRTGRVSHHVARRLRACLGCVYGRSSCFTWCVCNGLGKQVRLAALLSLARAWPQKPRMTAAIVRDTVFSTALPRLNALVGVAFASSVGQILNVPSRSSGRISSAPCLRNIKCRLAVRVFHCGCLDSSSISRPSVRQQKARIKARRTACAKQCTATRPT